MKKYLILVLIVLLIGALTVGVMAGKSGQAGKSNVAHLYLYEKSGAEPEACDWEVVDGAWGKMKYNTEGTEFEFVFNGHGLVPGEDYTLIYYPDPWPGDGLICLGSGIANGGGEVHIADSCNTGDLPAAYDENATTSTYCDGAPGAKIWLIPTSDVDCESGTMTAWNHEVGDNIYLFEAELISFDDTDDPPPTP